MKDVPWTGLFNRLHCRFGEALILLLGELDLFVRNKGLLVCQSIYALVFILLGLHN